MSQRPQGCPQVRRRRGIAAALVLAALTLSHRPATAAWPHDPNNGNVPLCTAASDQVAPVIISDGAGGAIVAWIDLRNGADADVYAQRVSAAGVPLWGVSGVAVSTATGDQTNPSIATDGNGGAIVTWTDFRKGTDADIYAQRITGAGVAQWTPNGVALCTAAGDQTHPTVCADTLGGGGMVAWQDLRGGATSDIYAQRVNASGTPLWTPNGVAVCSAIRDQIAPAIAAAPANGGIIVWEDNRSTPIGAVYDIYAQRLNGSGVPLFAADGVALCTAANNQFSPTLIPDGSGGAIATWYDFRGGSTADVYAQRVNSAGVTQWLGDGVAVCTAAANQLLPTLVGDGSGGAIVTWEDNRGGNYDIYVQHVDKTGAAVWTPNGVAVCTQPHDQFSPVIASDGHAGAIVAWHDGRNNVSRDIYAQRVDFTGAPQWTANGVVLSSALRDQQYPAIVADGASGAIVAWQDTRGSDSDIYAQRVELYGHLGNPEPVIRSVTDVLGDQGGLVRISWDASYLDADPVYGVSEYRVFRQIPGPPVIRNDSRGSASGDVSLVASADAVAGPVANWQYVGTEAAEAFAGYSMVVPTSADSTAASLPRSTFFILALSAASENWASVPDSGYSVDNLPPATPASFTGRYVAGATFLHWLRNTEPDLAGYRLYRGTIASFTPGPSSQIAAPSDTGYADVGFAGFVYKLTAIDVHGNQSVPATLLPNGSVDVGDARSPVLRFAAPSPNPARGETMLEYALSRAGHVRLALYDAAGRLVQLLRDGELPAGAHRESLALRDRAGRELASGIYVVRLEAEGRVLTRRLVGIR